MSRLEMTRNRHADRQTYSLFHEPSFLGVGFAGGQWVRVQESTGIPSICWDIGHVIFAILQQAPIVPDVVSARRATPDSYNGDGVFLHTHTHAHTHTHTHTHIHTHMHTHTSTHTRARVRVHSLYIVFPTPGNVPRTNRAAKHWR